MVTAGLPLRRRRYHGWSLAGRSPPSPAPRCCCCCCCCTARRPPLDGLPWASLLCVRLYCLGRLSLLAVCAVGPCLQMCCLAVSLAFNVCLFMLPVCTDRCYKSIHNFYCLSLATFFCRLFMTFAYCRFTAYAPCPCLNLFLVIINTL